jgi:hypothetical protein
MKSRREKNYMKTSWLFSLLLCASIPLSCGMFRDEYSVKSPDPVVTTFRYPGIAELKLVTQSQANDVKNFLVFSNVGNIDVNRADIVIKTFKLQDRNFENLIRLDKLEAKNVLKPGDADTLLLPTTTDYFRFRENITAALVAADSLNKSPIAGHYRGSYITYKNGVSVFGGNVDLIIDIEGRLLGQVQAPNEFTTMEGTVTPDSLAFLTLQLDRSVIKRLQTSISPGVNNTLKLSNLISTNGADSTCITLKRQNGN